MPKVKNPNRDRMSQPIDLWGLHEQWQPASSTHHRHAARQRTTGSPASRVFEHSRLSAVRIGPINAQSSSGRRNLPEIDVHSWAEVRPSVIAIAATAIAVDVPVRR